MLFWHSLNAIEAISKSVGLMLGLFSCENISEIAGKSLAVQCFFTDHFNHKSVNKTTCRMPSVNPRQLWAVEKLLNYYD